MIVSAAPQRPIVGRAELVRDDLTDHDAPGAADHHRRDVVADGGNEFDDGRGDHTGHGERQRHPEEAHDRAVAEVGRGLQERAVDLLERHVDRQDRKRRPRVGQGEYHCEFAVQEVLERRLDEPQVNEAGIDDAVVAEHDLPGENPKQVAGHEGNVDQDQPCHEVLLDPEGEKVGRRVGHHDGDECHHRRHLDRLPEKLAVEPLLEEHLVVFERESLVHVDVGLGPEAIGDEGEDRQREQADHHQQRLSRTRFPWTQNWLNRSVQGGPEHDRQF